MAKITLDTITSSFASTSLFNTNFTAIKDELNDKVLYRDNPTGEANQMLNDLDMNSNDILNASSVNADVIVLNGTQITPTGTTSLPASGLSYDNSTSGLTASNVQDAIDEVDSTLDTVEIQQAQGQNYGKNLIINGDFNIWQRGTSHSSNGYGSVDRFRLDLNSTTGTLSQQSFTVGQTDVPNNPNFYNRNTVSSVAGAGNLYLMQTILEDVRTLQGAEVTLSFWAKADAAKSIATEFTQDFGTGGSPSTAVNSVGVTTHNLTTSWQKFSTTITLPSISGKTLGTDNNSNTRLAFWFDAGSNFDSRTNSLGQQSGTFDIANVQLEFGDTATEFEYVSPADQLARCQRYFERFTASASTTVASGYFRTTTSFRAPFRFGPKRDAPSISASSGSALTIIYDSTSVASTAFTVSGGTGIANAQLAVTTSAATLHAPGFVEVNGGEYIDIDAEL